MNLPVCDMLLCALMWWVATWIEPLYTCVYMYVFKLDGLSAWGHAFSKGGVCDTYENSENSGIW